jgi:hypothetical protein
MPLSKTTRSLTTVKTLAGFVTAASYELPRCRRALLLLLRMLDNYVQG